MPFSEVKILINLRTYIALQLGSRKDHLQLKRLFIFQSNIQVREYIISISYIISITLYDLDLYPVKWLKEILGGHILTLPLIWICLNIFKCWQETSQKSAMNGSCWSLPVSPISVTQIAWGSLWYCEMKATPQGCVWGQCFDQQVELKIEHFSELICLQMVL